jgi:hypothetical protein
MKLQGLQTPQATLLDLCLTQNTQLSLALVLTPQLQPEAASMALGFSKV